MFASVILKTCWCENSPFPGGTDRTTVDGCHNNLNQAFNVGLKGLKGDMYQSGGRGTGEPGKPSCQPD